MGCTGEEQPFETVQEQREHFKSDWHRFNVRRRLQHKPAVGEDAFEALMENNDAVRSCHMRIACMSATTHNCCTSC